jgi:hypothetical protein
MKTAGEAPDGKTLALGVAGLRDVVRLNHVATRKELFALPVGRGDTLAFSPDGQTLGCCTEVGRKRTVYLWTTEPGREARSRQAKSGR